MTDHQTASREEWLAQRRALLAREKQLTRMSDELARERQALPWVEVTEPYVFATEAGPRTLAELFGERSQLLVYHFMFAPDWDEGCVSCSSLMDHVDLPRVHLEHHDVAFVAVSRAPLEKLLAYRERMGWTFPWVSSHDTTFNYDFWASSTPEHPLRSYNFADVPGDLQGELPGMSAFVREDGRVFHTYSAHARGLDALWGVYQWLDRAPRGRNETGQAPGWMRRHDAYAAAVS
jgi:predicted dithiol-disulfide oxidoreductase (DUF899 family)